MAPSKRTNNKKAKKQAKQRQVRAEVPLHQGPSPWQATSALRSCFSKSAGSTPAEREKEITSDVEVKAPGQVLFQKRGAADKPHRKSYNALIAESVAAEESKSAPSLPMSKQSQPDSHEVGAKEETEGAAAIHSTSAPQFKFNFFGDVEQTSEAHASTTLNTRTTEEKSADSNATIPESNPSEETSMSQIQAGGAAGKSKNKRNKKKAKAPAPGEHTEGNDKGSIDNAVAAFLAQVSSAKKEVSPKSTQELERQEDALLGATQDTLAPKPAAKKKNKLKEKEKQEKKRQIEAEKESFGDRNFVKFVKQRPPRSSEVARMRMRYGGQRNSLTQPQPSIDEERELKDVSGVKSSAETSKSTGATSTPATDETTSSNGLFRFNFDVQRKK